jgi:hypothetical protein
VSTNFTTRARFNSICTLEEPRLWIISKRPTALRLATTTSSGHRNQSVAPPQPAVYVIRLLLLSRMRNAMRLYVMAWVCLGVEQV